MFKKNITVILFFALLLNLFLMPQRAGAWVDAANLAVNTVGAGAGIAGTGGIFANLGKDIAKWALESANAVIVTTAKVAALLTVQALTQAIIGDGGGSGIVDDWNKYLYISPQQRAMEQMNSFFNTVSKGRLSYLNYEGVGPNYDAYLVAQARQAIAGRPYVTNIQEYVTNPSQMFADGNMKGIMAFMQPGNNVASYTMIAAARYDKEFAKAQDIAKNEQSSGFLPVRKNGKITQPASIVASALSQIDQLGTQVIMNAPADGKTAAIVQIGQGAIISLAARTLNYAAASDEGKAAIRNKNDEFPFSLGYSSNGGIGISAGGVTASTGMGAWNGSIQLGNTCATGNFKIDGSGATVDIYGKKITCPAGSKSKFSGTGPSIGIKPPSITCTIDSQCNIPGGTTFVCNDKKCAVR